MNIDTEIVLKYTDLTKILEDIEKLQTNYFFYTHGIVMPAHDQATAIEYYSKTGINIVPEWFILEKFIFFVQNSIIEGEFAIKNSFIDDFDLFVRNEEVAILEKMIASSNVWNIDNTFSNLDIKWDIAYIVLDFLRCLSGKDRNKTINEIYKRNAPRIRTIEENKKLTEEGFLYIISNSKYFKIGVTRDLNSRFQTLKSASSVELQIVHSEKINGYRLLEKEIHKTFSDKRVSREWFDLTDKDIDDIKLLIKNWIDRSSNTNKEATCSSNTKSDYFWAKYIFSSTDDA